MWQQDKLGDWGPTLTYKISAKAQAQGIARAMNCSCSGNKTQAEEIENQGTGVPRLFRHTCPFTGQSWWEHNSSCLVTAQ